jgi:hypothetical protein
MYEEDERLTARQAHALAREWVKNRIDRPAGHYAVSQTLWVMQTLASISVAESLRNKECDYQLCERLAAAWDIIHEIWYEAAPEYAKRINLTDSDDIKEDEQARIAAAQHLIWSRHDPRRSFERF